MVPKLSDRQVLLLAAAAGRPDGSVLPTPVTPKLTDATLDRTLKALLGRGLITELPVTGRARRSKWADPDVDARPRGWLIITPAGLAALDGRKAGGSPSAPDPVAEHPEGQTPRPGGKLGVLLAAVSRPEGATIDDLTSASGWLPHTTRAALTRLRQRGFDVRLATKGARKAYCLAAV